MRVVPPITIDDGNLVSSTASEPMPGSPSEESIYSAAATYAEGAVVISTVYHRKFESLQGANVGKPLPVPPETETEWWIDVGPTNKWAMFDLNQSTQTVSASPLVVKIAPGMRINAVGLNRLNATSITISLDSAIGSPAVNYYTYTENLSTRDVRDWYDWCYEPFKTKNVVVRVDLPPYNSAVLTVTVTNTADDAACGGIVIGTSEYIGEAQRELGLELKQFSVIERDEFSGVRLVPRPNKPFTDQKILIDFSIVKDVYEIIAALDATPALWMAADDTDHALFAPTQVFGIYRNAAFVLGEPNSELQLKLEGI